MKIDTTKFDPATREALEAIASGMDLNILEYRKSSIFLDGGIHIEFEPGGNPLEELSEDRLATIPPETLKKYLEEHPTYPHWNCTFTVGSTFIHRAIKWDDAAMEELLPLVEERTGLKGLTHRPIIGFRLKEQFKTWQEAKKWQEYYIEFRKNNHDAIEEACNQVVDEYVKSRGLLYRFKLWRADKCAHISVPFPLSLIPDVYDFVYYKYIRLQKNYLPKSLTVRI